MRQAIVAFLRALVLDREVQDTFQEGVRSQELGRRLAATGSTVLAQIALRRSRQINVSDANLQAEGLASAYLAELALWIGDLDLAGKSAQRAWELAAVQRVERDFIRSALLQGRVALATGQLSYADERLHHALTRTRAVGIVEFELEVLVAIAELELKRGDPAKARTGLDDVWEAAERGPYPLQQADAFNVLAAIAVAEADMAGAVAAATSAYKAAWCDGPPYAYHWGLEKAKAHLAALGAPEPALPPFDESKFEPLPEVEINPKDKYWVDPDSLDQPPSS